MDGLGDVRPDPPAALGPGVGMRGDAADVPEPRSRPHGQAEDDGHEHLRLDLQGASGRQAVQCRVDAAFDRVLDGDDRVVGLAPAHHLQRRGHVVRGHLAGVARHLPERRMGEGACGPQVGETRGVPGTAGHGALLSRSVTFLQH